MEVGNEKDADTNRKKRRPADGELPILAFVRGDFMVTGCCAEFRISPACIDGRRYDTGDHAGFGERLLPVYQEADPARYLANLSALQMVAGNYVAAYTSRLSLRDRRRRLDAGRPVGREVIYDMYAHARAIEAENRVSFAAGFAKSFAEAIPRLNDQDEYAVAEWLGTSPAVFRDALQKLFDRQRAEDSIGQSAAVELIQAYLSFDAYRAFGPLVDSLNGEEDHRRYTSTTKFRSRLATGDARRRVGSSESASKPLPALLEFTIYDSRNYAKECAAHGYVG